MISLGSSPAPVPDAPVPHTVLARAGEGPWPRYRIVGLLHLGGGHLLAGFDGRETGQDVPDPTGLVQRRSLDGGRTWGPFESLREADRTGRHWYCDPSYLHDPASGRVFVFHTHAKDRGVWDAVAGTDDADRDVMGSAVGVSQDRGRSWEFRSVTEVAAPPELIRTAFPTSGAGIVLRRGPHAGRLLQPYCGWFRDGGAGEGPADGEVVRSYVLFSDDHGETWQRGAPVGEDMDETTIVELSDGRVLLNSRDHARGGHRRIAVSADGGRSWEDRGIDAQFVDPGNNAQLAARFPDAPSGDPRARELLLSNAHDRFARIRGTLSISHDDGESWDEALVFERARWTTRWSSPSTTARWGSSGRSRRGRSASHGSRPTSSDLQVFLPDGQREAGASTGRRVPPLRRSRVRRPLGAAGRSAQRAPCCP